MVTIVIYEAADAIPDHQRATPDRRLKKKLLGLLQLVAEKVTRMTDDQKKLADEVTTLKGLMGDLHSGISGIQKRLDDALAGGASGQIDPGVLSDLHGINGDLKSVVSGLASSGVPAQPVPVSTDQPVVTDQPPVPIDPGSAPQPVVAGEPVRVQFDGSNQAPNSPGGRNSSQLPNFDPSVAETA